MKIITLPTTKLLSSDHPVRVMVNAHLLFFLIFDRMTGFNTKQPNIPFIEIVYDEHVASNSPILHRPSGIAGVRIGEIKLWLGEMKRNVANGLPPSTRLRTCPMQGIPMQGAVGILYLIRVNQNVNALKSKVPMTAVDRKEKQRATKRLLEEGADVQLPRENKKNAFDLVLENMGNGTKGAKKGNQPPRKRRRFEIDTDE